MILKKVRVCDECGREIDQEKEPFLNSMVTYHPSKQALKEIGKGPRGMMLSILEKHQARDGRYVVEQELCLDCAGNKPSPLGILMLHVEEHIEEIKNGPKN